MHTYSKCDSLMFTLNYIACERIPTAALERYHFLWLTVNSNNITISQSPSLCPVFLRRYLPLFVFHKKAFMLMRPLLKTICCQFNSVLKPQSTSIMWMEGREQVIGLGLCHANLLNNFKINSLGLYTYKR